MAGVIEHTERQSEAAQPLPRHFGSRRRWWLVGALGVAVLVMWAAVWVGANVIYYQPLGRGHWWPPPNEGATYLRLLSDDVEVIPAVAGEEFRIGTAMTNHGPHVVTIERVVPLPAAPYIEHISALVGPPGSTYIADVRPFEPFDLHPSETVWIGHRYRFRECPFPWYDPRPLHERLEVDGWLLNGGQSWSEMTVEFSARGWTRHASVPLMTTPYLDGVGDECPAAFGALDDDRVD